MRLIDEKELINERPENLNPNMKDEIKSAYNKGWNACNQEWIRLIEAQPTAYNVDKVVRELEEESMCGDYDLTECKGDYTNRCLRCVDCVVVSKEAIDIVKRGGVE